MSKLVHIRNHLSLSLSLSLVYAYLCVRCALYFSFIYSYTLILNLFNEHDRLRSFTVWRMMCYLLCINVLDICMT